MDERRPTHVDLRTSAHRLWEGGLHRPALVFRELRVIRLPLAKAPSHGTLHRLEPQGGSAFLDAW